MEYEKALGLVHSSSKIGARTGFKRIRYMLELLGRPQDKIPFVHVAGTNGKGSTCAMTASVLKAAGYKCGLFVSPYVSDFRERIQLGGEMIPKDEFGRLADTVFAAVDRARKDGIDPTEFEVDAILALTWYAQTGCDIAVLEVGMGGRLDPTNVIPPPLVSAITSISKDHTMYLGDTVEKIAYEKCGIIKTGSRCAVYPELAPGARETVFSSCLERGVPVDMSELSRLTAVRSDERGSEFVYDGESYEIGLVGRHQIMNALTVISVCRGLNAAGFSVPWEAVKRGLKSARFDGRLERVRELPLCLIDGAHNPEKIAALCRALDEIWPDRRKIFIMGMAKDKDYPPCIEAIAKRSASFIAVEADDPRALNKERVRELASRFCANAYAPSGMEEAAELALRLAGRDDMIIACGSMYIIGDIKKYLGMKS